MWLQEVIVAYKTNSQALKLLTALAISDQALYTLKDGIIRFKGRVWLGHTSEMQTKVTVALHVSAISGHSSFTVTYARVK